MLIFKRDGHLYSLRRNLRLLVIACVLPAVLVSAALSYSVYALRREQVEQQTALLGRSVVSELEREIATIESALKILSTSEELVRGDMAAFHQRAKTAFSPGIVYNYILTDPQGRQLVNTLLPYGQALPKVGTPAALSRVFLDRSTVLTGIFLGPVVQKLAIAMGVPVVIGDRVAYSLNVGIDPARISRITQTNGLPEGWLVGVVDEAGNIVGRSQDAERFTGQQAVPEALEARRQGTEGNLQTVTKDGAPMYISYLNSKRLGWSVMVGAPRHNLVQQLRIQLAWVLGGMLVAFGMGLWLARMITTRVLNSVDQLNSAAMSAGRGEDVPMPSLRLEETEAVLTAVVQASKAMKQVKFLAQHDALTALPNRLLFDEIAERSLSSAARHNQPLALLALDLDGFKGVNDNHGHAAGDKVLQTVAHRVLQTIRASDIAARIGGDEFILLLVGVDTAQTLDTANRIIRMLSEPYAGVDVVVSASVGIALFPTSGTTLKALEAAADRALYSAKNLGRRRAVVAD